MAVFTNKSNKWRMLMRSFKGVWPALVTPFTAEDTVNVPVLRELIEYLINKRVDGFYVCGTTGEGIYMSVEERKLVAETVIEQVHGRVPVIVHVGCVSVRDAVALAQHARQVGAAGVSSVLPPFYNNAQSLYNYFATIAAAVPDLPVLTYIFGGPMDAVALMREWMKIPNVIGTKYTGPNMYEFRRIVELRSDNWTVFSGMDEQCLFAAMFGANGNIGSTLNFMPGVYREIHACCQNGALVRGRELQIQANKVTSVLLSFGFPGALKEVMRMLSFDCGKPRLPNLPLPEEKRDSLHAQLETVGFSKLAEM
jgi:N-acetylneuraminate lyase